MPHSKLSKLSGIQPEHIRSHLDHHPAHEVACAGMTPSEMKKFLREEQAEGAHNIKLGKRF